MVVSGLTDTWADAPLAPSARSRVVAAATVRSFGERFMIGAQAFRGRTQGRSRRGHAGPAVAGRVGVRLDDVCAVEAAGSGSRQGAATEVKVLRGPGREGRAP
ncbi:hypothetical protein GCM10009600_34220 [Oerskovia paurometabola]